MRLRLWISKMRTGKAVMRVGRDSEVAYSTDQSTRILRFGKLEAEGGLRKVITYQTQRHQHCRKEETERQPHQRFTKTCGIVVRTMCKCRREDIWWSNRCTICIGYRIGNGIVKSPNARHYIHPLDRTLTAFFQAKERKLCKTLLSNFSASLSSPHILLLIPSSDSVCVCVFHFVEFLCLMKIWGSEKYNLNGRKQHEIEQ